jgi:hypothetical protein
VTQSGIRGIKWGSDGNLYVADTNRSAIDYFDGTTGAYAGVYAFDSLNQPKGATDFDWLPGSGDVVITSRNTATNDVREYGPIGTLPPNFVKIFANLPALALGQPNFMCLTPVDVQFAFASGTLKVNVDLDDYSGDLSLVRARLDLMDQSGTYVIWSQTIDPDQSAQATFDAVPTGSFEVCASATGWLSRRATVTITANATTEITVPLPNGDVDGTGEEDLNDFSITDKNYGLIDQ